MSVFKTQNFKKIMLSYLIIMLIPLLISTLAYTRSVEVIEQNVVEANLFKLNNFRDIMEGQIENIDKTVWELRENSKVHKVSTLKPLKNNAPEMYYFHEFFYEFNNMSIHQASDLVPCHIFFPYNDSVFSYRYLAFDYDDFYDNYFQYEALDCLEWKKLYFNKSHYASYLPEQSITINGETGRYISYLFSLPIAPAKGTSYESKVLISFLINVDSLRDFLSNSLSQNGGNTYILGKDGEVLASTVPGYSLAPEILEQLKDAEGSFEADVEREAMQVIYNRSKHSGLTFVSTLPLDVIRADLINLQRLIFGISFAILLVGFVLSFILSYRNTKPILRLLSDNDQLQEGLSHQMQSLQFLYMDKLLKNDFTAIKDLLANLRHVGITFPGKQFTAVLIRIMPSEELITQDHLGEQDLFRASIADLLKGSGQLHILGHNEMVLVLSTQGTQEITTFLAEVQQVFAEHFAFSPFFAVGETYSRIEDLHHSLKEAQYTMDSELAESDPERILWYSKLEEPGYIYNYTIETEQTIMNLVKSGNNEELKKLVDSLYAETILNKQISVLMKMLFLGDMHATVIRLCNDLKIDIDLREAEKGMSSDNAEYFITLSNALLALSQEVSSKKQSRSGRLQDKVLEYINENFQDSNLSVLLLSEEFNLSETYFSQFFREQAGVTFSSYLEGVRIKHSCKLLEEGKLTVSEIAIASGYNSSNTFRRAFKRVTGVSPSAYIDSVKAGKNFS